MVTNPKEKESEVILIEFKTIQAIQNSLAILDEKFDLRWKHQDMQFKSLDDKFKSIDDKFKDMDKKLDRIDLRIDRLSSRFWQIVMVLVAYPIALIVGKLCHVF